MEDQERETKEQLERQKREREEERKERETLTAALDAAKNKGKKLEEVGENYCRICILGIIIYQRWDRDRREGK